MPAPITCSAPKGRPRETREVCDRNASERPRDSICRTSAPVSVATVRLPGELVASQTCRRVTSPAGSPSVTCTEISTPRSAGAWCSSASSISRAAGLSGSPTGAGSRELAHRLGQPLLEVPLARRPLRQHRRVLRRVRSDRLEPQVDDAHAVVVDLDPDPAQVLAVPARLGDRQPLRAVALEEQVVGVPADDHVDQAAQRPAQAPVVVDAGVAEQHHDVGAVPAQPRRLPPYGGHAAALGEAEAVVLGVVVGDPDDADAEVAGLQHPGRHGARGRLAVALEVAHHRRGAERLGVARDEVGPVAQQPAVAGDRGVDVGRAQHPPARDAEGQRRQPHGGLLDVAAVEQQHRVVGVLADLPGPGAEPGQGVVPAVEVVPVQQLEHARGGHPAQPSTTWLGGLPGSSRTGCCRPARRNSSCAHTAAPANRAIELSSDQSSSAKTPPSGP